MCFHFKREMYHWGRNYLPTWIFSKIQSIIHAYALKHFYKWTRKICTICIHQWPYPSVVCTIDSGLCLCELTLMNLLLVHLFAAPSYFLASTSLNKNVTNMRIKNKQRGINLSFLPKWKGQMYSPSWGVTFATKMKRWKTEITLDPLSPIKVNINPMFH